MRRYLKWDTPEEVEQVHESVPQSGQSVERTGWEPMLLVPQYFLAWNIYLDICILYYGILKTRGVLLAIAFAFGFYSDELTFFSGACEVFVGHCISNIIFLKYFFTNKERVAWLYNIVGEKRIRHKIYD